MTGDLFSGQLSCRYILHRPHPMSGCIMKIHLRSWVHTNEQNWKYDDLNDHAQSAKFTVWKRHNRQIRPLHSCRHRTDSTVQLTAADAAAVQGNSAAEAPSVWQHSAVSSRQQPTLPRYRLYASPTPSHARQHDASCHSAFLLSYLSKSEIQTKPPT